jgi:hypothetical protein
MAPIPVPLPPVVAKVSGGGVVECVGDACALRVGGGAASKGAWVGVPLEDSASVWARPPPPPPPPPTPHAAVNATTA